MEMSWVSTLPSAGDTISTACLRDPWHGFVFVCMCRRWCVEKGRGGDLNVLGKASRVENNGYPKLAQPRAFPQMTEATPGGPGDIRKCRTSHRHLPQSCCLGRPSRALDSGANLAPKEILGKLRSSVAQIDHRRTFRATFCSRSSPRMRSKLTRTLSNKTPIANLVESASNSKKGEKQDNQRIMTKRRRSGRRGVWIGGDGNRRRGNGGGRGGGGGE